VDTDGDAMSDVQEIAVGRNPRLNEPALLQSIVGFMFHDRSPLECEGPDEDSDGLADCAELLLETDPGGPDSDGDGFTDGAEVTAGSDPLAAGSFPLGNTPPVVTSAPVTTAVQGGAYRYDVAAADPDASDRLVFSLLAQPGGMRIDAATGALGWIPATPGDHPVTVRVDDGRGGIDLQAFTVVVGRGTIVYRYGQGRLIAMSAPSGERLSYGYDARGNLVSRAGR
jgi:YD repeat-containing protein